MSDVWAYSMMEPRFMDRSQRVSNDTIECLRAQISDIRVDMATIMADTQHAKEAIDQVKTALRNMGNRLDGRMTEIQSRVDSNHQDMKALYSSKGSRCDDHNTRLSRIEHLVSKVQGGSIVTRIVAWAILVAAGGILATVGKYLLEYVLGNMLPR